MSPSEIHMKSSRDSDSNSGIPIGIVKELRRIQFLRNTEIPMYHSELLNRFEQELLQRF